MQKQEKQEQAISLKLYKSGNSYVLGCVPKVLVKCGILKTGTYEFDLEALQHAKIKKEAKPVAASENADSVNQPRVFASPLKNPPQILEVS